MMDMVAEVLQNKVFSCVRQVGTIVTVVVPDGVPVLDEVKIGVPPEFPNGEWLWWVHLKLNDKSSQGFS